MMSTAVMRCRMSRNEDGSSKRYTSALRMTTVAMASRCSSPPERVCTSRSRRWSSSRRRPISSSTPRSSRSRSKSPTFFPTAPLAIAPSSCGLCTTVSSSSKKRVK
mmetsp:Transcript_5565/g.18455  ORF Transcript_5565/g.18455 Transcript_5565/m.18455 type:complete len:106 (-) Transcript_5565:461-778(-)